MVLLAEGIWQNIEAWLFTATTLLSAYAAMRTWLRHRDDKIAKAACAKVESEREAKEEAEKRKQREADFIKVKAITASMQPAIDAQTEKLTESIHSAVDDVRREVRQEFSKLDERLSKVESAKGAIDILREWHKDMNDLAEQLQKKDEA